MTSEREKAEIEFGKTKQAALPLLSNWLHERRKFVAKREQGDVRPLEPDEIFDGLGLPPFQDGFTIKEFAVFLLRAGAEIEHSLAIQYLYAAYSIDETSEDEGSNTTLNWKTVLRLVAREEMAHLVTVQNLLLTLGAPPHLNRGPLHGDESRLPLPFKLERLDMRALRKFVLFESPALDQLRGDDLHTVEEIRKALKEESRVLRVGSIYAAVYWLFMKGNDPEANWPFPIEYLPCFEDKYEGLHLADGDFVLLTNYEERAAVAKEWGVFEASTHVDSASPRETALASLRWIMTQGEGPNAIEDSHFCHFLEIYKEFSKAKTKFNSLILKVPKNPRVRQPKKSGQPDRDMGPLIGNPGTKRWAALFNLRYSFLLLNILDSLEQSRKTGAGKRRTFAQWAVVEMEYLKKIGQALPRMDMRRQRNKKKSKRSDPQDRGPRAGAPFQRPFLPAAAADREKMRRELLEESGKCVSELRDGKFAPSIYTGHAPTAAIVPGLLDAIARQDDEMREAFQ